jgi:hypothetical protein
LFLFLLSVPFTPEKKIKTGKDPLLWSWNISKTTPTMSTERKFIRHARIKTYRQQEFQQFIANLLLLLRKLPPDKPNLKKLYQELAALQEKLLQRYKSESQRKITDRLTTLDKQRGNALVCLRKSCEAYVHHIDAKQREAGKLLLQYIDKYGSRIYQMNYSAETITLKTICKKLLQDKPYRKAVQAMHMLEVVEAIKKYNEEFEQLFVARLELKSREDQESTAATIREIADIYRNLILHLSAFLVLEPDPALEELACKINRNIDVFNQLAEARRKGKKDAAQQMDSTEEEEFKQAG